MLSLEPFAAVMRLANVDAVFKEIGEGTIGKGDAAVVFCDFGVAALGDDLRRSSSATSLPNDLSSRYSRKMVRTVSASDLLITSFLFLAS